MSQYNPIQEWRTKAFAITAGSGLFTTLPNEKADEITFVNNTGVALDIIDTCIGLQSDQSQFVTIPSPGGLTIQVASNAAEIAVRRNDQAATSTPIAYIKRRYIR